MTKNKLSTMSRKIKATVPKARQSRIGIESAPSDHPISRECAMIGTDGDALESSAYLDADFVPTVGVELSEKQLSQLIRRAQCALRNWRHSQTMAERSSVEKIISSENESAIAVVRGRQAIAEQWQAIGMPQSSSRHADSIGDIYVFPRETIGDTSNRVAVEPIPAERLADCFRETFGPFPEVCFAETKLLGIVATERAIRARLFAQRDKLVSRSRKLTADARAKPYRQDVSWLENVTDEQRNNLREFGQLYAPKNGKQCVLDFFSQFGCPVIGTIDHKTGAGIAQIIDLDVDAPQFHEFAKRLAKRLAIREGVPMTMVSGERIRYRKGFANMLEKQAQHESDARGIDLIESTESIEVQCADGTTKTVEFVTVERDTKAETKAQKRIECATASIQRKADKERQTHKQSEYVADVLAECVLLQLQARAGERPFGFAACRRLVRRYVQRLGIDRVKRDMVARLNLTNAALAAAKPETIGNQDIWQVGKGIYSESAEPKRGTPAAQIESAYVPTDPMSEALERGGLKLRIEKAQETTRDEQQSRAKLDFLDLISCAVLTDDQKTLLLQLLACDNNQTQCAELLGIGQDSINKRLARIRAKLTGEVREEKTIPAPMSTRADDMKRRPLTVGIDNRREVRAERDANGEPIVKVRHYVAKTR